MDVFELIKKHEGFDPIARPDADGNWVIGHGHELDGDRLQPDAADLLLLYDLAQKRLELKQSAWFTTLDPIRQAAILDIHFCTRAPGVFGFSRMLNCLQLKDWTGAHDEIVNSLFAKEDPSRAVDDAQMILTGQWPGQPKGAGA
jgi:GH24 family phage-related lysozyme (muramidase)